MGSNDEDDIIKRWTALLEKLEKRVEKLNVAYVREFRHMEEWMAKIKIANKSYDKDEMNNEARYRLQQLLIKQDREKYKENERAQRQRKMDKAFLDDQHAENVRRNIRLRHSFQNFEVSLSRVVGALGGIGYGGAAGMGFGKAIDVIQTQTAMTKTKRDIQTGEFAKELNKMHEQRLRKGKTDEELENDERFLNFMEHQQQANQLLKQLKTQLTDLSETSSGQDLERNQLLRKLAMKFESVSEWVGRNKTGILISAVSIGLLVTTFKKMLSVSPMLQKMLELMNMTFGLILRPFGDFIGFVLRPIAMLFLSTVMPFFRKAYPFLANLGNIVGTKLAEGDILGAIFAITEKITIWDVLDYLMGNKENTAGEVGSVAAALGAPTAALAGAGTYGAYKVTRRFTNNNQGTNTTEQTKKDKHTKDKKQQKIDQKTKYEKLKDIKEKVKMAKNMKFGLKTNIFTAAAIAAPEFGSMGAYMADPEGYRNWWFGSGADENLAANFLLYDPTTDYDRYLQEAGLSPQGIDRAGTGDTIITPVNIQNVSTTVDVNEVENAVVRGLNKNGKSRY
tara:strand:- start:107 stop:1798 length:1692 start_codon:yes stop_codon:yes gene_type:complete